MSRALLPLLGLCTLVACSELPGVKRGVCGNAVVEEGEDCDTYPTLAGSSCRAPGQTLACHLDCRAPSAGPTPSCPSGWGCGLEGVCRPPTGELEPPADYAVGGARSLLSGDFDGDGRSDLLSRDPLDALGAAPLLLHYFDAAGQRSETRSFPKTVAAPQLADLNGDRRSDLLFVANFQVDVILGRPDHSLVPETFSSYLIADSELRVVGVHDSPVGAATPLLVLTSLAGVPGLYTPSSRTGRLEPIGPLPSPLATLIGDPVTGDIIDAPSSPCAEVVLAFSGATFFTLVDPCQRDGQGMPAWREPAISSNVALEPPAAIDSAPLLADIDGNGKLDVLVGAGGGPYVAYGDGSGLATATPYQLHAANNPDMSTASSTPLAVGDVSGDGFVDFVFSTHLLISQPAADSTLPAYRAIHENLGAAWTLARIADLNGNGKLDVVTGSSAGLGVDFFSGTDSPFLVHSRVRSSGTLLQLAVGDFDGDQINDLAFVEAAPSALERDALLVAYGNVGKAPEAARVVARVSHAEQLGVYPNSGMTSMLLVSQDTRDEGPTRALSVLDGSPDRIPSAPHTLVSFSDDGFVRDSSALALVAGSFTRVGQGDVMALGTSGNRAIDFWLLSDLAAAKSTPTRLSGQLDEALSPIIVLDDGVVRLSTSTAAADFDGDGLDEALWVVPTLDLERCGLSLFHIRDDGAPRMEAEPPLMLAEPCIDAQVAPLDVDADGAPDLLLLSGNARGSGRKLLVLWNDGAGGFSEQRMVQVSASDELPLAFASLPESPAKPLAIAYVTETALRLSTVSARTRSFGASELVQPLERGSGLAAGDFNGDRAQDLAVIDAGNLRVLLARLKAP